MLVLALPLAVAIAEELVAVEVAAEMVQDEIVVFLAVKEKQEQVAWMAFVVLPQRFAVGLAVVAVAVAAVPVVAAPVAAALVVVVAVVVVAAAEELHLAMRQHFDSAVEVLEVVLEEDLALEDLAYAVEGHVDVVEGLVH